MACRILTLAAVLLSAGAFGGLTALQEQQIRDAALRVSLDPKLVQAIIKVESNFDPRATSHKGAMGWMQLMPKTADSLGVTQPYHSVTNVQAACEYLRFLINRYRGKLNLALAAYNAGPRRVDKAKGVPQIAQKYVEKVLKIYKTLKETT